MSLSLASSDTAKPGRRRRIGRTPAFAYAAVAPTLLIVCAVVGIPLAYSVYLSLNSTNPITKKWIFVGLNNYVTVLTSPDLWWAIARTAYFAGFAVVGTTILGTILALVLNQRFPGRGLLRSVVLVPWAMAPVSVGVLWSFVFAGNYGTLNALLTDLGLASWATPWLGNGFRALNLVALTHVWNQAPLTALMVLAGLQSMPGNLHKAAMLDGAGPVARFFKITLPWLKPNLLFISIIATINALMAFDILWIMTRGGPGSATTVFAWLGYVYSFQFFKFGEGAAMLYVLTILSFLLAIFYFVVLGPRRVRAAEDRPLPSSSLEGTLKRRAMAIIPPLPRRWHLPRHVARPLGKTLFFLLAVVIFIWSALPVLSLVLMSISPAGDLIRTPPSIVPSTLTFDNFRAVLMPQVGTGGSSVQAQRVPYSLLNSFLVGAAVSLICVVLGTFAGYAFARYEKLRFFKYSLWALLLTRMTPALTLVLPFFIMFRTVNLIDTRTALIISYCSFLLPLSAWMMKSYIEGVPKSLDRAALIDGCSRFKMMWTILIPVVRPGIIAALIFCFLASWNEFLMALILTSTPNSQTIPVVLSGFLSQAQFYEYGPMFAASVLSILPPVLIAFVFQRYLVQGALSGAVKG
ncbi:multiple sugar transport system permease protein [Arboricoccus pini]|uniref:Multiple sugar transport system permease protein n=1 Tax=Arboricoccus pini TaxID=1963835 RepID=A0A212RXY9_9PROT|nr:ABC transporter permease subunit [Arboricoccus pini]SNB77678.1 multiple sugar transport system permease protein [Arboricoccus pini]